MQAIRLAAAGGLVITYSSSPSSKYSSVQIPSSAAISDRMIESGL